MEVPIPATLIALQGDNVQIWEGAQANPTVIRGPSAGSCAD